MQLDEGNVVISVAEGGCTAPRVGEVLRRNREAIGAGVAGEGGVADGAAAAVVANADRVGGVARLQSAPAFSFNNPAAATEAVGLLQTIGANINVVIVFDEDIYATMEAMNEQGLLGPDYVTVISDTTTTASTGAAYIPAHGSADKLAEWLRGAIRVYWPRPHWAHP